MSNPIDDTKTIIPVPVQAYHISAAFEAGSYRLVTGAAVDQKIYITGLQVINNTMPFRLEDSTGTLLCAFSGNSMGSSGGVSTAAGADIIAVFSGETATVVDLWLTAFIV